MKISLMAMVLVIAALTAAGGPMPDSYLDSAGQADQLAGGVRMIPVTTPAGTFHVWTKRVGNNPRIKVLLLHGGPGMTHEYFEAFDGYFPAAGIEYFYYDQLGSAYSDQPDAPQLWDVARSSKKWNKCDSRSVSTRTTSICWANRGVASSRWSTR
jgi:proline iminopeptidase